MYQSSRFPSRVVLAIIASAVFVSGALILRSDTSSQSGVAAENITVTAAPPREPIPVADSDGDGVPDWQDALQRTDALIINQNATYTEPTTLTGQFAEVFFEQMVRNEEMGSVGMNTDVFTSRNAENLLAQAQDVPFSRSDIVISGDNSPAALKAYFNEVVTIILTYTDTVEDSEAEILLDALNTNNAARLNELTPRIEAYRDYVTYTKALPVPSSLANLHIALLNNYQAIGNDIAGMQATFSDPALAMIRLERYERDAKSLAATLQEMIDSIAGAGVIWTESDPAAAILDI